MNNGGEIKFIRLDTIQDEKALTQVMEMLHFIHQK